TNAGAWVVRIRNVLENAGCNGADSVGGNFIAGERRAGQGIVDGNHNLSPGSIYTEVVREISGLLSRRRHGAIVGVLRVLLVPFLRIIAEGPVPAIVDVRNADGTTYREAVVVFMVHGRLSVYVVRVPRRPVEEAYGIEEAVSVDLEKIAVIAVGSRFHLVGQRTLSQAVLRRESGPLNLVFLHQIERRVVVHGVALRLGLGDRNAVVDDFLFEVDAAAHAVREIVAGCTGSQEL